MSVTMSAAINLKILDFNLSVNHVLVESPGSNVLSKTKQQFLSYISLELVIVIRINFQKSILIADL